MRRIVLALAAVLALTAGCVSPVGQQTATPAPTPDFEPGVSCTDELWVSFYGLEGESLWTTDEMRVGYPIPANTSFLVVTYVDGTVGYTKYVSGDDTPAVVDGALIPLDDPLSGEHTVRVVVYSDENGNERFDAGTDRPCLADGERIQIGPRVVDFDRFADGGS